MQINEPDTRCYESSSNNPVTEFALTLLPDAILSRRLLGEVSFVILQVRNDWPNFRKDPFGSIALGVSHFVAFAKRTIARPQMAFALATSCLILACAVVTVVVLEREGATRGVTDDSEFDVVTTLNFATTSKAQDGKGVGVGEKGRVGFARGGGEGSLPQPARSRGGGGGGLRSPLAASQGRPPIPSNIPAPIPTTALRLPQALPVAGIDLDPALWRKLDYSSYGDPRSKSTTPSNGSGDGGGVGSGNGTGIGEGDGPGFGRGFGGNMGGDGNKPGGGGIGGSRGNNPNGDDDPDRVYPPHDVSTRPRVITKPEPQYTEQARRDSITGTVILRVVFSSAGQVTNIQAVQKLGGGLTEKAIAAAREIRFVPAMRHGHAVSTYMQLEYNSNLF
jgi:TonB family protein